MVYPSSHCRVLDTNSVKDVPPCQLSIISWVDQSYPVIRTFQMTKGGFGPSAQRDKRLPVELKMKRS